jgi:hypothetical protein
MGYVLLVPWGVGVLIWYPAIPQSRNGEDLRGRRSIKCRLGKDRTRVFVFSMGPILGGHDIETLVDIDILKTPYQL